MSLIRWKENVLYLPHLADTDRPALAYVKGSRMGILLDCGNSAQHARLFMKELLLAGENLPKLAILTHSHWDHSFGMSAMPCPVAACEKTAEELETMCSWSWTVQAMEERLEAGEESLFSHRNIPKEYPDLSKIVVKSPDILFEHTLTVDLGGERCIASTILSPHETDCVICYFPGNGMLFLGDSYCSVPVGEDWIYDKERLSVYIQTLESYPPGTFCIKGHHPPHLLWELLEELRAEL